MAIRAGGSDVGADAPWPHGQLQVYVSEPLHPIISPVRKLSWGSVGVCACAQMFMAALGQLAKGRPQPNAAQWPRRVPL